MLTMHYLDILTRQLRVLGYNHLALPVLAFQDLLSRSMLINHSLNILIHARYVQYLHGACACVCESVLNGDKEVLIRYKVAV